MTNGNQYSPGLEGVIAAETRLSEVDGTAGRLVIAGYPLEEITGRIAFEEMMYLLWYDRLPTASELSELRERITIWQTLPTATMAVLRAAVAEAVPPMDALRMAAGTLDAARNGRGLGADEQAVMIAARMPQIVTTYWRLLHGAQPVAPDPQFGVAANFLFQLDGNPPSEARVRALDTYLTTVADHGLNASTFAMRVIVATQSDLVSAVTGAVGALKGPLHGGAPGPALDMVFEIGAVDRIEPYLRAKLARGERLMGFGHRIYKVRDPRAEVLRKAASQLFENGGDSDLYRLVKEVEDVAVGLLNEYKPGRKLRTNVEFYTALLLHGLGMPTALFTPTFAVGRTAGWLAHGLEQQREVRLIRPQSRYVGARSRSWVPLQAR